MGYYEVHCVKCGKKYESSIMAFDFDAILKKSLDISRSRSGIGFGSELDPFREIKLGLYFPYFKLMNTFGVTDQESRVSLKARDILEYVEEKYKVTLGNFISGEELLGEETESLEFVGFCDRLEAFTGNADIDQERKRGVIRKICSYLVRNQENDTPLLDCTVQVRLARNDMGEEFASALEVTYFDGSREYVDHMVCLHCGSPFFPKAGMYQEYVIGMVGSARVGKTAYLAALINELNPPVGRPALPGIAICSENDRRWRDFTDNVLAPYRRGEKIKKTEEIDEMVSLFTVHMLVNGRNYLFTFVDMPGEAFVSPRTESGEQDFRFVVEKRPILKHTDIFWFCIAPVQIDSELMGQNEQESSDDRVETDMDRVIGNIRPVLRYLRENQRMAAAVLLSRSDEVSPRYELFEPRRGQQLPMAEGEIFRWDRFVNFAKRVRDYFGSDTVKYLETDFGQMFHMYNYFAVAAYGRSLSRESREGEESRGNLPSHILDPFLWSLAVLKILTPGRHGEIVTKKGLFGLGREVEEGIVPVDYDDLFCG